MPKRKYAKRTFRKRKKRKMSKLQTVTVRQPGTIVPDRLRTSLSYHEVIQSNPGALTGGYLYNLNSLYDPNRTGTGHQPMGYDQLVALYNRYRVHGCAYELTVSNLNTPVRFTIAPHNGSGGAADVDDNSESPYSRSIIVNTMSNGGGNVKKLKGYIGMKKMMGRTMLDDRDEATFGTSPSEIATLSLKYESLDGATTISSINWSIKLKYYTELFDRIALSGS